MELAQDAPPNPQHRVGTIGVRPSQRHDALRPACLASKTSAGAPERPPPQLPRNQGAETNRGVRTSRPLNSAVTALPPAPDTSSSNTHPRHERAQRNPEKARAGGAESAGAGPPTGTHRLNSGPLQTASAAQQATSARTFITPQQHPPAPRASGEEPRAGASGWSGVRRRGQPTRTPSSTIDFRRSGKGASAPTGTSAPSWLHSGAVPVQSRACEERSAVARSIQPTTAADACGGRATSSRRS